MKLAAAYVRVSTEEQAMRGYSIEAQRDALRKYARENGYKIVAEYSDEGVSGKKPYNKRPALAQFMSDIQNGMAVDVLLFCKLDRFYRSVKLYYQAVEILDRCGVAWKAILENYETETANGRFTVNIILSVAENEADRTSERIKFVFEDKISKGAVTGRAPIGYKIVDHKFQIDPEKAEIVRALFQQYELRHSPHAAVQYLYDAYGVDISVQSVFYMLHNRIYYGYFKGNPTFCEPIITEEQFNRVQAQMKSRHIRRNPTGNTYLFAGMLTCGNCGRRLAGQRVVYGEKSHTYYRCNAAALHANVCARKKRTREDWLENWLLENIGAELERQRMDAESEAEANAKAREQERKKPNRASILRKLNRLKDLYMNDLIDLAQYKADYERYNAQLAEADAAALNVPQLPDFQALKEKVMGIETFYQDLGVKERQAFWLGLIREIRIDMDDTLHIFFK